MYDARAPVPIATLLASVSEHRVEASVRVLKLTLIAPPIVQEKAFLTLKAVLAGVASQTVTAQGPGSRALLAHRFGPVGTLHFVEAIVANLTSAVKGVGPEAGTILGHRSVGEVRWQSAVVIFSFGVFGVL